MAVTQQLVRITAPRLTECRRSADALDELCSFRAAPREDHLDLDWWPVLLKRAWERAGVGAQATMRLALDGDDEVNPSYRDHPDTIFDHPVTALEPPRVGEVAAALRAVPPEVVRAAVPSGRDRVEAEWGAMAAEVVGDLAGHMAEQHALLRDFYVQAAERGLAVVLWWD
ncbi:hypothetical protein ACIQMJ_19190 [Actinosynnema sp. NPDC091369]